MKKHILNILIIFFCLTVNVFAGEIDGRVSIDNFYSKGSSASHDYNITTFRLKLNAYDLISDSVDFHFNGGERLKSSSSDVTNKISQHRIFELNFDYASKNEKYKVTLGRQDVDNSPGSSVDGLNLNTKFLKNSSIGFFGGLKPDPYMESFHMDFSTFGTYYSYSQKKLNADAGFVRDIYKGETDRDHLFLRSNYTPIDILNLNNYFVFDLGQDSGAFEITNLNLNATITPTIKTRISAGFMQYKSLRYKKSMNFTIDRNNQQRFNIRIDYKLLSDLTTYSNYIFRVRSYDNKSANKFQIGLRGSLFYFKSVYFHTRYTKDSYFTSNNNAFFFELNRTLFDKLDAGASIDYEVNNPEIEAVSQTVTVYNLFFDLTVSKRTYLGLNYEYTVEKDINSSTIFSKLGYRF